MRIDWWTLALQTANVLILIWLLSRFLFRPVAEIVARRQDEANKLLADAAAVQRQADEARADLERARANIGVERDSMIADAHATA
jgi:F-type H+-transporting ATPase subunit b